MPIDPKNLAGTATLTFSDEFNSLSLWNGQSGTWATNYFYNDAWGGLTTSNGAGGDPDQQFWYINSNYAPTSSVKPWTVSNGVLTIRAAPASPQIQPLINHEPYTSGELNSYNSFSQTYGYFEMRAQLPDVAGMFPAFWLIRKDGTWPPELDIMEVLGKDTTILYNTVHTAAGGSHTSDGFRTQVADMSAGFHTYGADWQADYITWYFDGQKIGKLPTPPDMNKAMFIQANLAVGGGWAGPANTTIPADMKIDYIRVYQAGGSAPAPAPIPAPAPAPAPAPTTAAAATTGSDLLVGTALDDRISGKAGNDTISGGDGNDYGRGEDGNDSLSGGAGADDLNGNAGADTVAGGAGDDRVLGGRDTDKIYGDDGNDYLSGDDSNDFVYGNLGNDTLDGGATGNDQLRGGQGDDVLRGGSGADWLSGDRGADTMTGGAGADVFHASQDSGVDRIVDFHASEGDRVQLDAGTVYTLKQIGADTVIQMSDGAVTLVGVSLSSLPSGWLFAA